MKQEKQKLTFKQSTTSTTGGTGLGSNTTSGGLGSSSAYGSTNSGYHSSNLANKADPRIDSDNDRVRGPDSHGVRFKDTEL